MTHNSIDRWLAAWGYKKSPHHLHRAGETVSPECAYKTEIEDVLDPQGPIRAQAVFDVEGVPTICFLEDAGDFPDGSDSLDRVREKIWNQNLISIVLVVRENEAVVAPVSKRDAKGETIPWGSASESGSLSRADVQSGEIFRRHADWFDPESRIDRDLLRNICKYINILEGYELKKIDAQFLMAQVLFVSYLEHREIVGSSYRAKHELKPFKDLVDSRDVSGITKLLIQLKADFNGDFLEPETSGSALWDELPEEALVRLEHFLDRVDLETNQLSLWGYDFRYIPVELLSGIYESFLSDEKRDFGAYYTPRHLANLAVDQVFSESNNILAERIFDGACGSGILLTTAYRRMLTFAEAKKGSALCFEERSKLLTEHVFGSDLSESACRVTAFSLYLSMLERLQPNDIADLQDNGNVKLPNLSGRNLFGGTDRGDFFSDNNPLAASRKFTVFISNPPWVEPKKSDDLLSDTWAAEANLSIPRRQLANAFMYRAVESMAPNGRFCFILPISSLAAPTSASFLKEWLKQVRLKTLINFGDLRKILFSTAKQPCIVATASMRPENEVGTIPGQETFEYWVPKADVSFAFGRLALHGSDRHIIQTRIACQDNEILTSLYWGTPRDIATITRLRLQGTLNTLFGSEYGWRTRKGFHKHDSSIIDPVSSEPLKKIEYLDAKKFRVDGPVLDRHQLATFPEGISTVARLPDDLISLFSGPRIVFTDGATSDRRIRAAFSDLEFSFSSSIGVIGGPKKDANVLRFVSAYLHSNFVQYFLLLTAYQLNFERERVTLKDIKKLPFVHPDMHENPERAWEIINRVAARTVEYEKAHNELLRNPSNTVLSFESEIAEYLGLSSAELNRVKEVAKQVAPNLQPSSIEGLDTDLQRRPSNDQISSYSHALRSEILNWSKLRGGNGDISVSVNFNSKKTFGPLGIIKVEPSTDQSDTERSEMDDFAVSHLLKKLQDKQLLPLEVQEELFLATDTLIRSGDSIYLVKPLVYRLWLQSEAFRDADRIVHHVLSSHSAIEHSK